MKKYVIIVAGGSGQRMLTDIPKQFLTIAGKCVLLYSLETFVEAIPDIRIILVLPEAHLAYWKDLVRDQHISIAHSIVIGGETRSQSVKNGLRQISEKSLVGIHDGVRPLITPSLIKRLYAEAEISGNVIPVISVAETVRQIDGDHSIMLDRNQLRLVQTPQIFHSDVLHKAYENCGLGLFTDDAAIVEAAGYKVHLCAGDPENIKLTLPTDFLLAEAILQKRNSL